MRTIVSGLLASLLLLGSLPSSANQLELKAMAPDHVGLTVRKSPVLYFYISQATSRPILFTPVDSRRFIPPLYEGYLPSPTRPGYVAIRLEDLHIMLEEGIQYPWFVSVYVMRDLAHPVIVAGGVIERVDSRSIDYDHYDRPCDNDSVRLAAKGGFWYDAMACLNELIEANPQDRSLPRMREELLRQVGIILPTAN